MKRESWEAGHQAGESWSGLGGVGGVGGCSKLLATKQCGLRKQAGGDPRVILSCRCFSLLYIDHPSERSFERGPLTVGGMDSIEEQGW